MFFFQETMNAFEAHIRVAVGEHGREKQTIPGVVVAAADRSTSFKYQKAFGFRSVDPTSSATRMNLNSTFWIASCTKLFTSIAALQCVERGLVSLDEDVSRILPEWKAPDILVGFEKGTDAPVLKRATRKITLRHLLTHSAGMGYDFMSAKLMKYREVTGTQGDALKGTMKERYLEPLLYEPGEGWAYSCAIDWAGQVVERLSGMTLEDYMAEHIWKPLDISSTTFRLNEQTHVASNLVDMASRDPTTGAMQGGATMDRETPRDDFGGGGLYSHPVDYIKLLTSILRNDEVLLKRETVKMMFTPQLPDPKYLMSFTAKQERHFQLAFLGGLPLGTKINWGLCGLLNMEDVSGMRSKGALSWSGLPNLFWWIDPVKEVCGIYATNILPVGDEKSVEMNTVFERSVMKHISLSSKI